MLDLAAGVLIGFGLSACTFSVVLAAFGKAPAGELAFARVPAPAPPRVRSASSLLAARRVADGRYGGKQRCRSRVRHAAISASHKSSISDTASGE